MKQATYQVQVVEQNSYAFMSIGKKGIILKVVEFAEIRDGIYNLGFGDYDFAENGVDDKIVSDNGDTEKVLATVIGIIREFLEDNPTYSVFVSGSTPSRTRLYQIAISLYFEEFSKSFQIFGNYKDELEPFQKRRNYESFLIQKLF